jgi:cytoskeletal protein RodZ
MMNKLNPSQVEQLKEIGTYLRQKRLEKSLSLEAVAARTHIRLAILESLEKGEIEQLPEPIYIQGFIRSYGNLLQLDGKALAKRLSASNEPTPSETPPQETPKKVTPPATRKPSFPSFPDSREGELTNSSLPTSPSPLPGESSSRETRGIQSYLPYLLFLIVGGAIAVALYLISRPPAPETASQQSPTPVVKQSPPSPSPQPSPSPTAAKPAPVSATVKLTDSSWMKVEIDGKPAFEGVLNQGSQKTWTAQKQISLRVGNAGAVSLSVNQKPPQVFGNPGEVKAVVVTPTSSGNF